MVILITSSGLFCALCCSFFGFSSTICAAANALKDSAAKAITLANLVCQSNAKPGAVILPAIDARMDEVYWAVYRKISEHTAEQLLHEKVQAPESIDTGEHPVVYGVGSGWQTYSGSA